MKVRDIEVNFYENDKFPKGLRIVKKYADVEYESHNIETALMSDGYVYGVAENLDTGYMFWTRGRKKQTVVSNLKKEINVNIKDLEESTGSWVDGFSPFGAYNRERY